MSISLQESKAEGSSKSQCRRSSRRNPLIMPQEDYTDIEMDIAKENKVPQTPKSNNNVEKQFESPSVVKNNTLLQTPRRSSRKSVKPVQEYEDIVSCKRQLRSVSKVGDEINKGKEDEETNMEVQQPRWTPAKVGRVSRKRGRKSRKTIGDKNKSKLKNSRDNEDTTEVKEHLQNNEVIESEDEQIKVAENINEIVNNVEICEKSEDIAEVQIATIKDDTFNSSDCIMIHQAEDEEDMQPLQLFDDENKSNLKNSSDNENTTEVKEYVQNDVVIPSQDENIKEAVYINVIASNGEKSEKQKTEVEIATTNDDIFNSSDCIMIHQAEDEEMQPLQLSDDENQSNLKNSSDNENTTEVKEHVQNDVIQSQDENIKETDTINEIANNVEKSEKSEECKTEVPIVTINDDTSNASDEDEGEMQPLQFSDDESSTSPPPKVPRIILTTDKGVDQSLNVTAPLSDSTTPKRYSKTAKRMPTPYRKNTDVTEIEDDIDEKCAAKEPPTTIEISKMQPKEAVLRSIRKRSFSVCIGGAEAEKRKNVTFYSPANTTTIFEDLDIRMVQSVKKNPILKPTTTENFITQRRKRSLSFDEAMINKSKLRTQTPSKMGVTPQKIKPARTKLPNFAAIHHRNFEKMENLVDHVNRKAERAKVLTNSTSKDRVASATATNPEKSKAVKRLNLQPTVNLTFLGHNNTSMFKAFETSHKDLHDSKLPIPRIGVCKPLVTTETTTQKENREVKLPNPRLGIIKQHIITVGSNKNKQITPAKNALKPIHTRQVARPAFNLSTALESHANHAKSTNTTDVHMTSGAVTKPSAPTTNTTVAPTLTVDEKMASRRQRHMDMFKGRAASTRTTPGTAEKRFGQLIKGVRSNRRFELQMAHRKNMEH